MKLNMKREGRVIERWSGSHCYVYNDQVSIENQLEITVFKYLFFQRMMPNKERL